MSFWNRPRFLADILFRNISDLKLPDWKLCGNYEGHCLGYGRVALKNALSRLPKNVPKWGSVHPAVFVHPIFGTITILVTIREYGGGMPLYSKGAVWRGWIHGECGPLQLRFFPNEVWAKLQVPLPLSIFSENAFFLSYRMDALLDQY